MNINKVFIILLTFLPLFCTFAQKIEQNSNNITSQNSNLPISNNRINADASDLLSNLNPQSNQSFQGKIVPVDKSVDPKKYFIGSNDIFVFGMYGYINQQTQLVVTLEGSLIIPSVGEIKVLGLNIEEAKRKVSDAVKKRYKNTEISLSLYAPRPFIVTVSSLVQKRIEVSSLNRVSDIVSLIYYDTLSVSRIQYAHDNSREFFVPVISLRNIELVHKDGSSSFVDLYKFFFTNDDKLNPYLSEGDIVKIPFGLLDKNYITINGAVQLAGVYEYNKADNLESVIQLGRGFDQNAQPDSITLYRLIPAENKYEVIYLSYENNRDYKINNYDRLFVKYKSDFIINASITILGEVNNPGIYPITFKNMTLKEAIQMAGGFKPTAYLPLSIVFRKNDQEYTKKDTNEILINMRTNDLIVNEKDKASFERDIISRRNRMVVDFDKLFNGNDLSQNIILEDKDIIYINDDKKIVYVYGQVLNEGYVSYKEGADYDYYISRAGGYSLAADKGDTRVIKFNSRGWYKADETKVMSGDFIYVPKKTPTEFRESLTIIATMIGVVASVLTTYLLIRQNQ